MVQFGKKLLESRYEPWAEYYLDYQGLKGCLGRHKKKQKLLEQFPSIEIPPPPPPDHGSYQQQQLDQLELGSPPLVHHHGSPLIAGSPRTFSSASPQLSQGSFSEHTFATQVHVEQRDFETFLEDEVEKIGLFFLQIQGELAAKLGDLRKQQTEFYQEWALQTSTHNNNTHPSTLVRSSSGDELVAHNDNNNNSPVLATKLQQFYADYRDVAVPLFQLIRFVEINVTGIRKILKKHDKVTKKHLTYQYVSLQKNHKDLKHLWTSLLLQQYEGITALNSTLKVALVELRNMEHSQQQQQPLSFTVSPGDIKLNGSHHNPPSKPGHSKPPLNPSRSRHQPAKSMPNIVLSQEDIVAAAMEACGHQNTASMTPQALSFKRHPYGTLWETTPTGRELDAIMLKIEAARRHLHSSSNSFQDMLAAQIVMLDATGSMDDMITDEDEEEDEAVEDKWMSHLLNLVSTLLYMTNYYVVAPTSGHYAQMLGGDAALAGIIIGMTPIAALVSTVLYSWWTNYSYKTALMFASTCSIAGNLFYALGLPCQSLSFVMVGRLLNGFGSARSINRRYIADTFPPRQRTAESANFVTAGALGMSAGPAIASLLHIGASESSDRRIGNLHKHTEETFVDTNGVVTTIVQDDDTLLEPTRNMWWTPENAPGWFMFVVWSVFLALLWIYFEDPPNHTRTAQKTKVIENGVVSTKEEKEALLGTQEKEEEDTKLESFDSDDDEKDSEIPLWRNIPVMTTFVIYFVLKLILECLLSSTATLTDYYFHWDSSLSGIYLAVLGLLMLPANLGISILARNHDDRELIFGCEVAMLLGCCGIVQYTGNYTAIQYVIFSVFIFLATNALEGPNMSLLSKTIPKSWRQGIFNVGLLATEAGTLGRAIGDLLLSAWGFKGLGTLLNDAFRTMSLFSAVSLALTMYFFDDLEPHEKDD